MPVDRPLAADLADRLVTIYSDLELSLTREIGRRLARGLDSPQWADEKLAALGKLRRWASVLLDEIDARSGEAVAQAITLAYERGGDEAVRELARHASRLRRGSELAERAAAITRALPGSPAIARLVYALASTLRATHLPVLRWTLDVYREVIATSAAPAVLAGTQTRRQAAERAWQRLLADGVKGFTDTAGRRWSLASYVEMATRTSVAQAAVEGHLDRLGALGLDLVIVSDAPQECERCRPWEGKVLTRGGPGGVQRVEVEHAVDDRTIHLRIDGSVDEAIRGGLMHPNCRHSLSAYLPGLTVAPRHTADPAGDRARQRLRALERQVRAAKLQEAAALTKAGKAEAAARVRALQARIREHVAATEHLGIFRKPERERVNLGMSRERVPS